MPIFDAYLMVDWSANSTPKTGRDSIWAAWGRFDNEPPRTANLPTRQRAKEAIAALLAEAVTRNLRVLVGFDFAYAYPRGFARLLGLEAGKEAWRRVWKAIADEIHDDEGGVPNANDRFAAAGRLNKKVGISSFVGPFWACPTDRVNWLSMKKPDFGSMAEDRKVSEFRRAELQLQEDGNVTIQSAWKLFTSGSVGSQTLLGIPVVRSLVDQFEEHSLVWPFQTGFTSGPRRSPLLLHAEIWPGILGPIPESSPFICRDQAQVFALVSVFRRLDQEGELENLFAPNCLDGSKDLRAVEDEEGWILGAGIAKEVTEKIRGWAEDAIGEYSSPLISW